MVTDSTDLDVYSKDLPTKAVARAGESVSARWILEPLVLQLGPLFYAGNSAPILITIGPKDWLVHRAWPVGQLKRVVLQSLEMRLSDLEL